MREKIIQNKGLNRKISVAPMMDWTDNVEMSDSIRGYEGQKAR